MKEQVNYANKQQVLQAIRNGINLEDLETNLSNDLKNDKDVIMAIAEVDAKTAMICIGEDIELDEELCNSLMPNVEKKGDILDYIIVTKYKDYVNKSEEMRPHRLFKPHNSQGYDIKLDFDKKMTLEGNDYIASAVSYLFSDGHNGINKDFFGEDFEFYIYTEDKGKSSFRIDNLLFQDGCKYISKDGTEKLYQGGDSITKELVELQSEIAHKASNKLIDEPKEQKIDPILEEYLFDQILGRDYDYNGSFQILEGYDEKTINRKLSTQQIADLAEFIKMYPEICNSAMNLAVGYSRETVGIVKLLNHYRAETEKGSEERKIMDKLIEVLPEGSIQERYEYFRDYDEIEEVENDYDSSFKVKNRHAVKASDADVIKAMDKFFLETGLKEPELEFRHIDPESVDWANASQVMQYAEIYPISKYRGRLGDNLRDDEDFIKHLMDEYGESALELGSSRVQSIIYKEKNEKFMSNIITNPDNEIVYLSENMINEHCFIDEPNEEKNTDYDMIVAYDKEGNLLDVIPYLRFLKMGGDVSRIDIIGKLDEEKYYDEYTEMINNGTLSVASASDIQNLKEQNKLRYPNLEHEDSKEHEFDQFNWEKEAKEIINRNYKEKVERAVSRQDKKEKKLKNSKKHNGDKEHSAEKISKFLEENARKGQYEETQGTLAGGQWIDGQYVENDDQR